MKESIDSKVTFPSSMFFLQNTFEDAIEMGSEMYEYSISSSQIQKTIIANEPQILAFIQKEFDANA